MVGVKYEMKPSAQLPCLALQGDPCFIPCQWLKALTYVGKLALCTQGHGEGRGGRQLGRVVGFRQPPDGMGMSPLLGVLLGLKLVPGGGGRIQSGQLQGDLGGFVGVGALKQEKEKREHKWGTQHPLPDRQRAPQEPAGIPMGSPQVGTEMMGETLRLGTQLDASLLGFQVARVM